jgi:Rrf2 family protein
LTGADRGANRAKRSPPLITSGQKQNTVIEAEKSLETFYESMVFVGYSTSSLNMKDAMLTAKGKYSLKALAHLAKLEPGATTQAGEIAETNNIPKKFLDAILGELRNAGIVFSRKGPGGGYRLARAPSVIKIGHVIRTIDGPLAPIACASRTAYQPCRDCEDVKSCTVRLTMTRVRDAMSDVLDRVTLADMVAMSGRGNLAKISHKRKSSARS